RVDPVRRAGRRHRPRERDELPRPGRGPPLPGRAQRDRDPLPLRPDVLREQGRAARGQPLPDDRRGSRRARGARRQGALGGRVAGPDGIDVLAFGQRMSHTTTYLPRPGVVSFRLGFTLGRAVERHVWEAEAEAGDLELPEPGPRPANIVNREDAESAYGGAVR